MISSVPFPAESTRTYEISGSVSQSLNLGQFVFDPQTFYTLFRGVGNVLYRVVNVAFSANVPQTDFTNSFLPTAGVPAPVARFVQVQGPSIRDLTAKPFPIWSFYNYRDALAYFMPSANNIDFGVAFAGTFQGAALLVPELVLNYSVTIQECSDERFVKAFTEGKF